MKIEDFMSPSPHCIEASQSAEDALQFMRLHKIRHLPVIETNELIGVVSDREAELACQVSGGGTTIKEICQMQSYTVTQGTKLSEVAKTMADKKLDCALVIDDDGILIGVFTSTDLCRALYIVLGEMGN